MTRINLLPWREIARQQRQKDFIIAIGVGVGIAAALAALVHFVVEDQISGQQQRNQYLQSEIAKLEAQIKEIDQLEKTKTDLISRMEIIQNLQTSRPEIVKMFDDLVTATPDGLYLFKIQQVGNTVTLEGNAQSNARVSAFMRGIEAAKSIGKPRLLLIENKDKTGIGLSHFRLAFDQNLPNAPPDTSKDKQKGKKKTPVKGAKPAAKAAAKG